MAQPAKKVKIDLDAVAGRSFLKKLAGEDPEDRDFRERLSNHPVKTLAEFDIDVGEEHFSVPVDLPSEEDVKRLLGGVYGGAPPVPPFDGRCMITAICYAAASCSE